MARTYRNPEWPNIGKEAYLADSYDPRETTWRKTRKSKEVYEAEIEHAKEAPHLQMVAQHDFIVGTTKYVYNYIPQFVSRYYITRIPYPKEEQDRVHAAQYDTFFRDGHFSETGIRTAFKKRAAGELRRANKRYCQRVMNDDEYEGVYPISRDQNHLVWAYW
jgi:hypothetical protein